MPTLPSKIAIIGTGGFAKEVLCLIHDLDRLNDVACFIEPSDSWEREWKGKLIHDVPVLPLSGFDPATMQATIAVGDSGIRERILQSLPTETTYATLVHPTVVRSPWVELGEGCIVCAGCILTCDIKIGKQSHLNLDTTIGHDCTIGDYFTTAPSVNVSGHCEFGDHVYLGTGVGVRDEVIITDRVIVGMGGMVVKNLPEPGVYVGMPAKRRS